MKRLAALALAAILSCAATAQAETRQVFVELFTSQGCSSCPPADAFLHELAKRDDVIAVAMHVDYWDYIGWKDQFARPEFTERQYAYAQAASRKVVYTPQMIINGADHVVGNRPMDANDLIERHKAQDPLVDLQAKREGNQIKVSAAASDAVRVPMSVKIMHYRPKSTVEITRGENAGRTIEYANVVTDIKVLTDWDVSAPLTLDVPIDSDQPALIVVQRDRYGPVEAVVRVQ